MLEECSHKISLNSTINYEVNNNIKEETTTREETNKNDILKKAKFLLNQTKDYQEAEKILFEEIAYNENSFELWYYYLYAITKGLKENIEIAKRGGKIANNTRVDLEKEIGESIITKNNVLN